MPTYVFEQVKIIGSKSGICAVCGKRCTRSESFSQTINPFNKNPDGSQKNREQIKEQLRKELSEWRSKPVTHSRCE